MDAGYKKKSSPACLCLPAEYQHLVISHNSQTHQASSHFQASALAIAFFTLTQPPFHTANLCFSSISTEVSVLGEKNQIILGN